MGRIGEEKFRREYGCCAHDTQLTLQDESGKIFTMSIGDLFDNMNK